MVIFGTGGVGMNAVQGARYAGGKNVIAIDPVEYKREQAMEFGATHAFAGPEEAQETIVDMTRGQLADKVICTVGEMDNEVVKAAVNMTGKAGTIVITGVGYYDMVLPGGILIGYHRRMQGSLFGGANPLYDIPMILGLWQCRRHQADRAGQPAVHPGPDQRGLPGHDGRQEPPRRHHARALARTGPMAAHPILDPTGTTATRATDATRAPRRRDLRGATVGLLVNTKQNAAPFLDEVGRLARAEHGAQRPWPAPRSTSPRPRPTTSSRR